MSSLDLTVRNPSGLHARPAAAFVKAAARFVSTIRVENLDRGSAPVDGKSILGLMTIGVSSGNRIRVTADGPDETDALAALEALVLGGTGEAVESAPPRG